MKITLREIKKIVLEELIKNKKLKTKILKESRMAKKTSKVKGEHEKIGADAIQSIPKELLPQNATDENLRIEVENYKENKKQNNIAKMLKNLTNIFLFLHKDSFLYYNLDFLSPAEKGVVESLVKKIFRNSFELHYSVSTDPQKQAIGPYGKSGFTPVEKKFFIHYSNPHRWIAQLYHDLIEDQKEVSVRQQGPGKDRYKHQYKKYALPFPSELEDQYEKNVDEFLQHLEAKRKSPSYTPSGKFFGLSPKTDIFHAPIYDPEKIQDPKLKQTIQQNWNPNTRKYHREGVDLYVLQSDGTEEYYATDTLSKRLVDFLKDNQDKLSVFEEIKKQWEIFKKEKKYDETIEFIVKKIKELLTETSENEIRENDFFHIQGKWTQKKVQSIINELKQIFVYAKKQIERDNHYKPARLHGVFPPALRNDEEDPTEIKEDEFQSDVYWFGYLGYPKSQDDKKFSGNYLNLNEFNLLKKLFGLDKK
jgi:hypothetical protein